MARRKRLGMPGPEDLAAIETGFAAKPLAAGFGPIPPIARVAGEAAAMSSAEGVEARVRAARDAADAERLRELQSSGHLINEIPVDHIAANAIMRDRVELDPAEMMELKASILANGVRLPVEVMPADGALDGVVRYDLISGWRRLAAVRALLAETGEARFACVPALVRARQDAKIAYAAMVEENEIRADLSHYERGRIAVVAVEQGLFGSVEASVDALFPAASKSKRSKIRSFALIHEALGDLLQFPTQMSERAGLRLAQAIQAGSLDALRRALEPGSDLDALAEWHQLERVIAEFEPHAPQRSRGGRPRRTDSVSQSGRVELANGLSVERVISDDFYGIRFRGDGVNASLLDTVMLEIQRLLEPR